nr:hypothetical protein [Tanacetum cinerariifolium]
VLDVNRLVNNLCTVWVGRHKLQANIHRFQREPLKRHNSLHNIDGVKRGNSGDTYNSNGVKGAANSYARIVKGSQNSKMESDSSPVMVLDDFCLNEKDYSLCLMGKVMMEFQTEVTKLKFQENSVMKTWVSQIQLASSDFNADGRVAWVKIKGKVFWVSAKEVPGWIPDFVEDNDEEEDSEVGSYEEVPNGEDVKNVEDLERDIDGEIVLDTKFEGDFPNQKGEEDSVGQGGSILQLIDDLVKVGETMRYDMKGCMKNMKEIIELQRANDGHR